MATHVRQWTDDQRAQAQEASARARAELATLADPEVWAREMPSRMPESRWHGVPPYLRAFWLRVLRGEASAREAIRAQCLECCGFDRAAVTTCASVGCPLWLRRPGGRRGEG